MRTVPELDVGKFAMIRRRKLRFAAAVVVGLIVAAWLALDDSLPVPEPPAVTPQNVSGGNSPATGAPRPGQPPHAPDVDHSETLRQSVDRSSQFTARQDGTLVTVFGSVVDADGQLPVPGARVSASSLQGLRRTAISDFRGSFSLPLPPQTAFNLSTEADGYLPYQRSDIFVDANTHLLISLEKELLLRGRVVDQFDKPVRRAEIGLKCTESLSISTPNPWTDGDGAFEIRYGSSFAGPKAGSKECEVVASHPAAARPATAAIELPTEVEIVLRLDIAEKETARVWGVVSDPEGRPLAGAKVLLFRGTSYAEVAGVKTDTDGTYRLPPVSPGRYSLAATSGADPGTRKTLTLEASKEYRVDFVVDPGESVKGRVLSPLGNPIAEARIECSSSFHESGAGGQFGTTTWTGEDGLFTIDALKRDYLYRITVAHPDYQPFQTELGFPYPAFIEIVLEEGITLGGVVSDSRGMPLSRGTLSVVLGGNVVRSISLEGSSGAFELRGLPAGTLEVHVGLPDGRTLTGTVDLTSNLKILVLVGNELKIQPY